MEIVILGTGCPKCRKLEKATNDAVRDLDIKAKILKEEDIMKIMGYGILHTPGLVINGKVVLSGRVPSAIELRSMLNQHQ